MRAAEAVPTHDCMDCSRYVVLGEGDDAFVERCTVCGAIRMESDGVRPMAWYATPGADFPWRYVYSDPRNLPDGPAVWAPAPPGAMELDEAKEY